MLYTEKKFGWTVTEYTNYQMFYVSFQHLDSTQSENMELRLIVNNI